MEYLAILIAWWLLSPFLRFFANHPLLSFLLISTGVFLYRRRRRAQDRLTAVSSSLSQSPLSRESSLTNTAERILIDLLILRNEITHQRTEGTSDPTFCDETIRKIDTLCNQSLDRLHITPDSQRWREGRDAAWELLACYSAEVSGPPPWCATKMEEPAQLALPFPPRTVNPPRTPETYEKPLVFVSPSSTPVSSTVVAPPLSAEAAAQLKPVLSVSTPVSGAGLDPSSISDSVSVSDPLSAPYSVPVSDSVSADADWVPATPSLLERTLQTVSRWPALLVPFLVQNILWFICGLCFVAGSTFLISSTSGQTNALTVSGVLFAYSGFLLWIGYRLRRARPELTSGLVLLAFGLLLIPLNIASAVRLITTAQTTPWIATGLSVSVAEVLGFYYVTMLVSGVMDRSLQNTHPQLFLGLTTVQVLVPLLATYPSWILVAITHCVLLGILAYGLLQFTHEWLHSIFAERRKTAYYAVGTLIYAAVVSFVHLTWGYPNSVSLPAGYYSPFLMAVCGLLFYVDAQLKRWTKQYTFLSRVSFLLYGLSILALLLSIDAPNARLLTLCLAIAVYSAVVWQYVTFTPLALLLICAAWLYHILVLQHLPSQWHLLASLPGLAGLLAISLWLRQRRVSTLISSCYWVWFGTTCAVCAWSLLHAHPSLIAMTTALVTMGFLFSGLRFAPAAPSEQPTNATHTDLRQSSWLYVVMLLGSLAVAYAPQSSLATWVVQTATGSIILAGLWLALGLQFSRHGTQAAEVLLNSTLLNLSFALMLTSTLATPHLTSHRLLPILLVAIGTGLLWMSLALRLRNLFYGTLILWAVAGVVLKLTYFPQPGAGAVEMFLVLSVWTVVWWLEHESEESLAIRQEYLTSRVQGRSVLMLLGRYSIPNDATYATMLRVPLSQTMVILWTVGLWHLAARFLEGTIAWGWVCSAGLGALGAAIGAGYFRLPLLVPVAVLLGFGTWLSAIFQFGISRVPDLGFAGALYSVFVWSLGIVLLNHPQAPRLASLLQLNGGRRTAEASIHWTTVVISLLCVATPVALSGVLAPRVSFFLLPLCVAMFLSIVGWRYQNKVHSYLALGVTILLALLSYGWLVEPSHASHYSLLRDHGVGLFASIIGLISWAVAAKLSVQSARRCAGPISLVNRLYHDPLCHVALLLAVFGMNQVLALAWVDATRGINILATTALFFAGAVLFAVSSTLGHVSLQIVGILAVVLATLWGEVMFVHPRTRFTLWPGATAFSDQWLILSLVSGNLALLSSRLRRQPERQLYARPIGQAALITYVWALCGAVVLFAGTPFRADPYVSLTFLVFMVSLLPLVQPLAEANMIRGFVLPLLGSTFLVSVLTIVGLTPQINAVTLLWGFTLWAAANFVLPRWNAQQPQWKVTPDAWPWFGLLAVSLSLVSFLSSSLQSHSMPQLHQFALLQRTGYFTAGAIYFFLMLRNSTWPGFSWIGVFLLTAIGVTVTAAWWAVPVYLETIPSAVLLPINPPIAELVWLNALLLVVPWWHVHGETLAARLGWRQHNLPQPLLFLSAGYFLLRLFYLVLFLCGSNTNTLFPTDEVQWLALLVFAGMLTLSFLHLWWRHKQTWEGHAFFAALSCTALAAWIGCVSAVFHFPFFAALWSAALCTAHFLWQKYQWGGALTHSLRRIMSQWVEPSLIAAITALVLFPPPLNEQILALLVLIDTAAVLGWRRQQRRWFLVAGALLLVVLHDWPLLWLPFAQISLLWPWYALQLSAVSWLLLWGKQKLQDVSVAPTENSPDVLPHPSVILVPLMSWAWKITASLAAIEWLLHVLSLFAVLAEGSTPQWLSENGDITAALGAAGLLLALGAQQAWLSQKAQWTYRVAAFIGMVGFYIRLILVGLAPASTWDTTALMVATYVLFALYHFVRLEPLFHIVMIMPFLLFATIPFQLASAHAGTALIAASALYLLTHRETERSLPLYLALTAFNAAVYVWIPVWAEHYHLVQLYVAPIALSVLLLAHLHRHELRPRVLNTIRLATTTALYVGATSDVFFSQGVGIFILALALSLAGIFLGVALRVRAFLYTGIASFVCHIGWQLIMLFPDQRLSQAVILLTLAAFLAGAMTWFNAQRENILRRVRIFRTDLETWA